MLGKILNSAKSGGLAYFIVGIMVASISLLVPYGIAKLDRDLLLFAWIFSTAISILLIVPFFIWFTNLTERWGWKLIKFASWKDTLGVAYWSVPGSLLGGLFWYFVYLSL